MNLILGHRYLFAEKILILLGGFNMEASRFWGTSKDFFGDVTQESELQICVLRKMIPTHKSPAQH